MSETEADDIQKLLDAYAQLPEVEWGSTHENTDAVHQEEFGETLRITREHFNLPETTKIHGLYVKGTDTVFCHTGNSPNGADHARILSWILINFPKVAAAALRNAKGDSQ